MLKLWYDSIETQRSSPCHFPILPLHNERQIALLHKELPFHYWRRLPQPPRLLYRQRLSLSLVQTYFCSCLAFVQDDRSRKLLRRATRLSGAVTQRGAAFFECTSSISSMKGTFSLEADAETFSIPRTAVVRLPATIAQTVPPNHTFTSPAIKIVTVYKYWPLLSCLFHVQCSLSPEHKHLLHLQHLGHVARLDKCGGIACEDWCRLPPVVGPARNR